MPKKQSPAASDQNGHHTRSHSHVHSVDCKPRIGSQHDAPAWLRQPFILSGYRLCFTLLRALLSPLRIHNETVNIWTHMVPTLMFIWDGVSSWYNIQTGSLSPLLFCARVVYPLSAAITLGASSTFHTCNCVTQDIHRRMRIVDFLGISGLIIGASWSVMHYTFRCHSETWYLYAIILTVLSISALVVPIIPYFHRDIFRIFRVLMHCALATGPFFMGLHAIRLWGFDSVASELLFSKVFTSYLFYGIGTLFYVSRFPERFLPGTFDLLGSSHQIWHCCVVFGAHACYSGLIAIAEHPSSAICHTINSLA